MVDEELELFVKVARFVLYIYRKFELMVLSRRCNLLYLRLANDVYLYFSITIHNLLEGLTLHKIISMFSHFPL